MNTGEPIYITIKNYLLEIIEKNRNVPGYKLPSENQLAMKFSASRISAKNAMRALEAEGLIQRWQGKGSFIADAGTSDEQTNATSADTVCAIFPIIEPYFSLPVVNGLRERITQLQMRVVLLISEDSHAREAEMLRYAQEIGAKGILICPVVYSKYSDDMLRLALMRFPLVQIDRYLPGLDLSYVACDHCMAAYRAVRKLLELGHTRIAFLNDRQEYTTSVADRVRGFEMAIREASPSLLGESKCVLSAGDPAFEEKLIAFLRVYQPTALITHSHGYGVRCLRILRELRKNTGLSIELALFDDFTGENGPFFEDAPIIIDQQPYAMGVRAADLLYQQIYGGALPRRVLLPEKIRLPERLRS